MDTNRVEARFADGTALALDCIAMEDEHGNTPADWRIESQKTRGKAALWLCLRCYAPPPCSSPYHRGDKKKNQNTNVFWFFLVRWKGLEPPAY